jgi:hypothetical protein
MHIKYRITAEVLRERTGCVFDGGNRNKDVKPKKTAPHPFS